MSHDVFTRRDALRQDLPPTTTLSDEKKAAAQRVIAAHSQSGEECLQFLEMLGLTERVTQ
jgi:hypothetical protein